jgi:hypothetical protein
MSWYRRATAAETSPATVALLARYALMIMVDGAFG